ncbi:uncharacterized protein LOC136089903 [Hydra vulgaris]|uniref:Uncharacterized protein LOC136089903 n=1 Tax=Hydra vulgaris TaxID=6087 RepID=A0ABM4DCG8_HYDVU
MIDLDSDIVKSLSDDQKYFYEITHAVNAGRKCSSSIVEKIEREFAVKTILKLSGDSEYGNTIVSSRKHHIHNENADSLFDLINWSLEKWIQSKLTGAKFIRKNPAWLENDFNTTLMKDSKNKQLGRPTLSFQKPSPKTKKRNVATLSASNSCKLLFAGHVLLEAYMVKDFWKTSLSSNVCSLFRSHYLDGFLDSVSLFCIYESQIIYLFCCSYVVDKYRWVCKHFGQPRKRDGATKKTNHQSVLPCGCQVALYIAYNPALPGYMVRNINLEHNHPIGAEEFQLYSRIETISRKPTKKIPEGTEVLLYHGANPTLVVNYLLDKKLMVKQKDIYIYNIKQKMKFRGSVVDEIRNVLTGMKHNIHANMEGYIEAITWSTLEQLSILHKFPKVVMMDGTYKVNNMAMPMYTLAIVVCNGIGQPVMHSLVDREDQNQLEMILEDIRCWTGDLLKFVTFVIDKDYAGISAIKAVYPKSRILLCRFL